jgi:hypothetical protein
MAILIAAILFTSSMAVSAQAVNETKTERMLKEIGQPYTRMKEGVYMIQYKGKDFKEISVVAAEGDGYLIGFVDVANKEEATLTPDIMQKLLEFNLRADFIKVGIGKKGTITVQTEQSLKLIDTASVREILDQLAAGANEVYTIVQPRAPASKPAKQ